jgi:hypothetical protein
MNSRLRDTGSYWKIDVRSKNGRRSCTRRKLATPSSSCYATTYSPGDSQAWTEKSAATVEALSRDFAGLVHEMEMNRISSDRIKTMSGLAVSLELLLFRQDIGYRRVEASLDRMLPLTEKTQKDVLLKEARAAQGDLKKLEKELKDNLDRMSETIVEWKLIELLNKIERSRPRVNRIGPEMDRMIEELLKK